MKNKEILSKNLIKRIKNFKKLLQEVELTDLEITLENFRIDPNREKEIVWWENLAKDFTEATQDKILTLEVKKELFKQMFLAHDARDKGNSN
jgi:hypothetical protein